MSARNGRNQRSEFVANLGLIRGTSVTVDCTKMSVKSGNLSNVINAGFNCTSEKFWAVPSRLCGSAKTSKVSRETIQSDKRSWKQRLQFIVYCSRVVDKFWR